jgi:hypothetical protein
MKKMFNIDKVVLNRNGAWLVKNNAPQGNIESELNWITCLTHNFVRYNSNHWECYCTLCGEKGYFGRNNIAKETGLIQNFN